ncbi:hypothetical protein L226DRAFT_576744 [Lentinus tigrinus ALCF2SS1-7]|uniref:Uncharacterized protein n=1 Tax=Lentinus tigrinus ALCF2SS1-6 TaxID=1328759 RepID=A0A5C2RP66_9APHY|nr:hypothetical protein L227DRAFT_617603 [Lentinus tigrinus ALCF2SS1-6]RPD68048.1 hypothetical protein L226DRAFT_576744 [Lentinus tigrinus ALCF2SS1-7]
MAAVHPASLVPSALHDPALLRLVHMPMDPVLTRLTSQTVLGIVQEAYRRPYRPVAHSAHARSDASAFSAFVEAVIFKARVSVPTLLVSLTYLQRVQVNIPPLAIKHSTPERVFLGALILAHKYANDCILKNKYWAAYTGFECQDIMRIERDFLTLLDYRLSVSETGLLEYYHIIFPRPTASTHHNRCRRVRMFRRGSREQGNSSPGGRRRRPVRPDDLSQRYKSIVPTGRSVPISLRYVWSCLYRSPAF